MKSEPSAGKELNVFYARWKHLRKRQGQFLSASGLYVVCMSAIWIGVRADVARALNAAFPNDVAWFILGILPGALLVPVLVAVMVMAIMFHKAALRCSACGKDLTQYLIGLSDVGRTGMCPSCGRSVVPRKRKSTVMGEFAFLTMRAR